MTKCRSKTPILELSPDRQKSSCTPFQAAAVLAHGNFIEIGISGPKHGHFPLYWTWRLIYWDNLWKRSGNRSSNVSPPNYFTITWRHNIKLRPGNRRCSCPAIFITIFDYCGHHCAPWNPNIQVCPGQHVMARAKMLHSFNPGMCFLNTLSKKAG